MDVAERSARSKHAEGLLTGLAAQGVVGVTTSYVDNAGISRVKSVPLAKLPQLAGWGAGYSPVFDFFRFDDWIAAPASGEGPVERVLHPVAVHLRRQPLRLYRRSRDYRPRQPVLPRLENWTQGSSSRFPRRPIRPRLQRDPPQRRGS